VLVVDRHALGAVDVLDLVEQVGPAGASSPLIRRMSCGTSGPSDERVARLDVVARVHEQVLVVRDVVVLLDARVAR
jgi:hypothetical protein